MTILQRLGIAVLAAAALAAGGAAAQGYPNRPITLICPWPAGGSTDTHLRKLSELASKHLGQPIIVENKPGAAGMLGPAGMARAAAPDGYTISQFHINGLRQPHMQKVDWDPLKDFTYIIGVSGYTFGVVVKSDSPIKSVADVIAYAKANPGKFSYSSTGIGTSPHLVVEELASKAGVQLLHVPFKGNADSTQALMGGHVMAQSDATGWGKFVDAGTFRLLVTFGEQRTRWGRRLRKSSATTSSSIRRTASRVRKAWIRKWCGSSTTRSRRRWTIQSTTRCCNSSTRSTGTSRPRTTRSGRRRLGHRAGEGGAARSAAQVSVRDLFNLDGRVALVTGGSRGLGLQMAEALGGDGRESRAHGAQAARAGRGGEPPRQARREERGDRLRHVRPGPRSPPPSSARSAALGPIDILVTTAGTNGARRRSTIPSRRGRRS
jgi:tripartite-type tricarboxylate transporter receptor subunit TctC